MLKVWIYTSKSFNISVTQKNNKPKFTTGKIISIYSAKKANANSILISKCSKNTEIIYLLDFICSKCYPNLLRICSNFTPKFYYISVCSVWLWFWSYFPQLHTLPSNPKSLPCFINYNLSYKLEERKKYYIKLIINQKMKKLKFSNIRKLKM